MNCMSRAKALLAECAAIMRTVFITSSYNALSFCILQAGLRKDYFVVCERHTVCAFPRSLITVGPIIIPLRHLSPCLQSEQLY